MTKEIDGYVSDLPQGCIIETDIYTERGVLLCPKMTIIDNLMLAKLSNYKGRIHAVVSYTEEPLELDDTDIVVPDEDDSIEFSDAFKKYAFKTLKRIFSDVDDVVALTEGAVEIGEEVYGIIVKSKALSINLEKLKVCDEYTYKHSIDVGTMAAVLAKALGENDAFARAVTISGLLHDIGKEKIPPEIINKPAKLTPEEYDVIKKHPLHGYRLLLGTELISEDMRQSILNHHENLDGTGYPRGLTAESIGKMAQILAIVDVYDALVTERAYKAAKSPSQAIEIMYTMSNKFNMDFFRTFLSIINAFPNGTDVLLSNGETATVMRQNKSYPLRPVVMLKNSKKVIDLAHDLQYMSIVAICAV